MDPVIDNKKTAKNIPVFSLGNPFDNIKIIAHTIMGSPRLNYDWNGYNIVAKTLKNEEVFSVISNIKTDHEYAESMLTVDKMNDFAEFGKLFYEFGSGALNAIAVALMNTSGNKRPLCLSEDFYSIKKLGIVFSKQFQNFQSLIGLTEYENEQEYYTDQDQHLDISNFIDEIDYIMRNAKKDSFLEFEDILCSTYVALTIYLTGVFIKLSKDLGININTIYGDGKEFATDNISDKIIKSNTLENDVKYKLISILYFYYLLTEFYKNNLALDFVDKINFAFYKIGEKISKIDIKTLEEEMDISYLFSQHDDCSVLFNILSTPSVVTNPSEFDYVLRDCDITDFGTIALPLYKYFSSNTALHGGDLPRESSLIFDSITKYDSADVSTIDILYTHFIENVANVIPASISPKYFYKISVYAAAFRKLKKSATGKGKETAALGLYQAEALLSLLYKEWIKKESYYREIGTGVYCKDTRYVAKALKAKTYIKLSAQNYINFVHKFENNDNKFKHDNFTVYVSGMRILVEINSMSDDLSGVTTIYNDLDVMSYDMIEINYENYEDFDKNIINLNKGLIPLISLFTHDNKYGYKYLIEILETDYQQKTIDQLSAYANDSESNYLTIYDCKLARALTNNIDTVLKDEKSEERFVALFNTFIKCVIPVNLAKNVMDKTDKSDEDFVGNLKPEEKYLPNIKSQRLFNFLEK